MTSTVITNENIKFIIATFNLEHHWTKPFLEFPDEHYVFCLQELNNFKEMIESSQSGLQVGGRMAE